MRSLDNNCNGSIDEVTNIYYADSDTDGYGDPDPWLKPASGQWRGREQP